MSINLSDVEITEFSDMVKMVYQPGGFKLGPTVDTVTGVQGRTYTFQKQGRGMAHKKAPQDDVVPMNLAYTPVPVILEDWHAADYTGIFLENTVNFNAQQKTAMASAAAIGRREDQLVIDALNASGTAKTIAHGSTNFTYEKFLELNKLLNEDVDRGERTIVMSTAAEEALLQEPEFISNDYVRNQVLNASGLDGQTILNYTFVVIKDGMDGYEGGLPKAANIRSCFAYQKDALGLALGLSFRTEVNYVPIKLAHLISSIIQGNAVAIDALGIVKIDIDETK